MFLAKIAFMCFKLRWQSTLEFFTIYSLLIWFAMVEYRFSDTDLIFKDKCNLFFAKCSEHIRLQIVPRKKFDKNLFFRELFRKMNLFFFFTN